MKTPCPCGLTADFEHCCGRYLSGAPAPDAERLMRSRYSAYVRQDEAYLLATWHPDTRPAQLDLKTDAPARWLGLNVKRHGRLDDSHAVVEFVARYKNGGQAHRLHEVGRFERLDGRWYYRDGDLLTK